MNIDTSTTIFGEHYDFPIAIAPSGYQKLAGYGGEVDVARGAFAAGTNFTLSSSSTTSLEDVMTSLPKRDDAYPKPWFQLYFFRDRVVTASLVQRAERNGYSALLLTVDNPVMGNRMYERREPLKLPPGIIRSNVGSDSKHAGSSKTRVVLNAKTAAEARKIEDEYGDGLVDSSLCWDEVIPWLRSKTKMRILVKGVMTGEDALKAIQVGVDGVVVSNHGGRQLDGEISTLEALPEVVDAVRGRVPVLIDGGISRGNDVLKALALGASMCLIGRSALWGLAWNGQRGVEGVLHILERELSRAMALMGAASLKDISRDMLGRPKTDGFGIAKL